MNGMHQWTNNLQNKKDQAKKEIGAKREALHQITTELLERASDGNR